MAYPTSLTPTLKTDWANSTPVEDTHPTEHNEVASDVEALKAKVGVDSSAVTTSHDYKLSGVTGSDKAASVTGSEVLTNKTLTTPTIGSFANANHDHEDSAGGGQLNASNVFSAGTIPTARLGSGSASVSTYLRGDQTWATIATGATDVTVIPKPVLPVGDVSYGNVSMTTTAMAVQLVEVPNAISINKISYYVQSHGADGTFKFGIYSADGTTLVGSFTSSTITSPGTKTETLGSPIALSAGKYYLATVMVSGTFVLAAWQLASDYYNTLNNISGSGLIVGTYAVSAGTLPSTITTTSIGGATGVGVIARFDN